MKSILLCLVLSFILLACGSSPVEDMPTQVPPVTVPPVTAPPVTISPYPSTEAHQEVTPPPDPSAYPEPAPVTPATPAPQSLAMLYFISDRGGQVDLWYVVIPGGSPTPVTDDPAEERWPAVSPSGHWVAYVAVEGSEQSIRMLELEVDAAWVVDDSASTQTLEGPAWLNATTLLYAQRVSFHERALYLATVEGPARPLAVEGLPEGTVLMDWSAAADRLVLVVGIPGESSCLHEAQIHPDDRVVAGPCIIEGYWPQLSPDGRYLAFKSPPYDTEPAGYILDLDTGQISSYDETEPMRGWDHDLAWSRDSRQLAFIRSSWAWTDEVGRPFYVGELAEPGALGGPEGLYYVELDQADVSQRTQVGYDTAPAWAPSDKMLAFVSNRDDFARSDIWLLSLVTGQVWALPGKDGNDWSPVWRWGYMMARPH